MRLSAILGLPIAEPDDARRDFPTIVDAPRTDQLDAIWGRLGLAGKKVQYGSSVVSMTGGVGRVTYPVPFAAPATVVAQQGATDGVATSLRQDYPSNIATGFGVQLLNSSAQPITSGSYRINWIAIGTATATARPAPDDRPEAQPR